MTGKRLTHELPSIDEGSWVYLIAPVGDRQGMDGLRERVVEACEASGWPALSWPPPGAARVVEPGHFFEGVRHAVGEADVVVAILGTSSGLADAELAMAYGHRRPIVGVRVSDEDSPASEAQAMLENYERARVIACDDVDRCAAELRTLFSDPDFAAVVRMAAGEHADDA